MSAWQAELNVRAYQLHPEGAADETEGDVTSCQIWMLPATVSPSFRFAFRSTLAEPEYYAVCSSTACTILSPLLLHNLDPARLTLQISHRCISPRNSKACGKHWSMMLKLKAIS